MSINLVFDESCPFCHEEIIMEVEDGIEPEPYECECGATLEVKITTNLSIDGKRRMK